MKENGRDKKENRQESVWEYVGRKVRIFNDANRAWQNGRVPDNPKVRNALRFLRKYEKWRIPELVYKYDEAYSNAKNIFRKDLANGIHVGHLAEMSAAWLLSENRPTYPASHFEDAFGITSDALSKYRNVGAEEARREHYGHTFDILTTVPARNGKWVAVDVSMEGDNRRGMLANVDAPNARSFLNLPGTQEVYIPKLIFELDHGLWQHVIDAFYTRVFSIGVPRNPVTGYVRDRLKEQGLEKAMAEDPIFGLIEQGTNKTVDSLRGPLGNLGIAVPRMERTLSTQTSIGNRIRGLGPNVFGDDE